MNSFNQFLGKHGFELVEEKKAPSTDPKEIELRLKLLEDDLGIDPSLEIKEEEK